MIRLDTLGRSWSDLIWRVRERLIRRRNSSMAQSTIDGREHNGCEDSTIFQARLPAESAKCCKRCVLVFLGLDGQGSIDWLRQYLVHQDCKIHWQHYEASYCITCQVQTFKVNAWMIHGSVDCMASLMKSKNTEIHTDAKLKCFEGNFLRFSKGILAVPASPWCFCSKPHGLDHCVRNRVRKTEQSRES